MNLRIATTILVLVTLAAFQLPAQQPEAIPAPPANESGDGELFVSPVSDTTPAANVEAEESVGLGSILVEATDGDQANDLSSDAADSKADDTLILDPIPADEGAGTQSSGATLSSTIEGIEAPLATDTSIVNDPIYNAPVVHESVVAEDPFSQPQVVQTPEFQSSPPIISAPQVIQSPQVVQSPTVVQPAYSAVPQRAVYQRPVYQQQPTVTRQAQQPRRMTMTVTETTTYRAAQPQAVRQASYYQRVPRAAGYPQSVVVAPGVQVVPVGVQAVIAPPRVPRPLLYSGPAALVPAQLIGGPVLGPAGQVPMPRAFVPGQPIRNFVRGIGPY